jgi:hypothetical protein
VSEKRCDDFVDGLFLSEKDLSEAPNKPRDSGLRIPDGLRGKQ